LKSFGFRTLSFNRTHGNKGTHLCRCGYAGDPMKACLRGRDCAASYRAKLSGPLLDRIDLVIDVPAVKPADLALPPPAEDSAAVAQRVAAARTRQRSRFNALMKDETAFVPACNAQADAALLDEIAAPDAEGRALLTRAAERLGLSARGWHRVLRVARTLADLDDSDAVRRLHIAEALAWRHQDTLSSTPQRMTAVA
jgi:magnesium chelatase family protein